FIQLADVRFGPITKIRRAGQKTKVIHWSAFQISAAEWEQVRICADILADANKYHHIAATARLPILHQVIPTLESLSSRWEHKLDDPMYAPFHDALKAALSKLNKYYLKLDDTDVYILSLFLHPYYKLGYTERKWGGEAEYLADLAAGHANARNWIAHARSVVEEAMKTYWPKRFGTQKPTQDARSVRSQVKVPSDASDDSDIDDYDRHRAEAQAHQADDGWREELD
ncbi:hypothetical protein C8Q76DRAFT_599836, partial [Earliella scabrosa]